MRRSTQRISRILALVMILGICVTAPARGLDKAFSDVESGSWYAQSVEWAVEREITNGTSETTFSPDRDCTKGQILTFLYRYLGSPMEDEWTVPDRFRDVSGGMWYSDAVCWAWNTGLFSGESGGIYGVESPCARADAVEFLFSLWGEAPEAGTMPFSDVPGSGTLHDAVAWAVDGGITNGVSTNLFSPDTICTRAQIVTLLRRLDLYLEQKATEPEVPDERLARVTEAIETKLSTLEGNWSVTYYDLETGGTVTLCAGEGGGQMVSASMIKMWIMAAAYDEAEKGNITLSSTVKQNIRYMIRISDNASANKMINLVGMDVINAYAASIGCGDTQLNRKMLQSGTENFTSTQDCATLLKMIYEGTCVSPEASAEMLSILGEQTDKSKIPAGVGAGATTYNKTGELAASSSSKCYVHNDAAIVVTASGKPYILCVMNDLTRTQYNSAVSQIKALSSAVYQAVETE